MADPAKKIVRKVFIATSKDAEGMEKAFSFLGDNFDYRASGPAQAEFILVDCNDHIPPREWLNHRPTFVFQEPCCPPILLVALSGEGNPALVDKLVDTYKAEIRNYPVVQTPDELLRTLQWLESIFPFYNSKNLPVTEEVLHGVTLRLLKSEMAA